MLYTRAGDYESRLTTLDMAVASATARAPSTSSHTLPPSQLFGQSWWVSPRHGHGDDDNDSDNDDGRTRVLELPYDIAKLNELRSRMDAVCSGVDPVDSRLRAGTASLGPQFVSQEKLMLIQSEMTNAMLYSWAYPMFPPALCLYQAEILNETLSSAILTEDLLGELLAVPTHLDVFESWLLQEPHWETISASLGPHSVLELVTLFHQSAGRLVRAKISVLLHAIAGDRDAAQAALAPVLEPKKRGPDDLRVWYYLAVMFAYSGSHPVQVYQMSQETETLLFERVVHDSETRIVSLLMGEYYIRKMEEADPPDAFHEISRKVKEGLTSYLSRFISSKRTLLPSLLGPGILSSSPAVSKAAFFILKRLIISNNVAVTRFLRAPENGMFHSLRSMVRRVKCSHSIRFAHTLINLLVSKGWAPVFTSEYTPDRVWDDLTARAAGCALPTLTHLVHTLFEVVLEPTSLLVVGPGAAATGGMISGAGGMSGGGDGGNSSSSSNNNNHSSSNKAARALAEVKNAGGGTSMAAFRLVEQLSWVYGPVFTRLLRGVILSLGRLTDNTAGLSRFVMIVSEAMATHARIEVVSGSGSGSGSGSPGPGSNGSGKKGKGKGKKGKGKGKRGKGRREHSVLFVEKTTIWAVTEFITKSLVTTKRRDPEDMNERVRKHLVRSLGAWLVSDSVLALLTESRVFFQRLHTWAQADSIASHAWSMLTYIVTRSDCALLGPLIRNRTLPMFLELLGPGRPSAVVVGALDLVESILIRGGSASVMEDWIVDSGWFLKLYLLSHSSRTGARAGVRIQSFLDFLRTSCSDLVHKIVVGKALFRDLLV